MIFNNAFFYIPNKYLNMPEVELPKHRDVEDYPWDERWTVLAWENEIKVALSNWYTPIYNDYIECSMASSVTRMLIEINELRKITWNEE